MTRGAALRGLVLIGAIAVAIVPRSARAEELSGQASVIDGDTLEIHGREFACGVSTRPNTISFAEVTIASLIAAAPRRRSNWMRSSAAARFTAHRRIWTAMDVPSRAAGRTRRISANGWLAMALPWIGRATPRGDTPRLSATRNGLAAECGPVATSSLGTTEPASARAAVLLSARTTLLRIPESRANRCATSTASRPTNPRSPHFSGS
jgi:hypothetical protein